MKHHNSNIAVGIASILGSVVIELWFLGNEKLEITALVMLIAGVAITGVSIRGRLQAMNQPTEQVQK